MDHGLALTDAAAGRRYWLRNGRIPGCLLADDLPARADGLVDADILIDDTGIGAIVAPGKADTSAQAGIDLRQGLVWPCFTDVHTHLDKGHTAPRAPNPDGRFASALEATRADISDLDGTIRWTAEDVRARMEFSLRAAHAHGTGAIRTHLNTDPEIANIAWAAFAQARDDWAGRLTLQGVSLVDIAHFNTGYGEQAGALTARHGGVLGAYLYEFAGLETALRGLFAVAGAHDLDLDLHVDETLDPEANSLARIAALAIETGFTGAIVAGHCCSLTTQDEATVDRTLDDVARAGISIVCLPMCNLYLQDREPGRTPRRRGGTLVHEMRARGIAVAVASDNTRDAFFAYGDMDALEVFRDSVRILHLNHPMAQWPALVTKWPAAMMGLGESGMIATGGAADLVLFDGRDYSELLSRPEANRVVLRAGQPIDRSLPDYRGLDRFMGDGHLSGGISGE